jgi:tRNA U38,U39,U40 pseudouridine synthase TruA
MQQALLMIMLLLCSVTSANAFACRAHAPNRGSQARCATLSNTELFHECRFCSTQFATRNALFRHVRSDSVCSRESGETIGSSRMEPTRYTCALQFSYFSPTNSVTGQVCGDQLKVALLSSIDSLIESELNATTALELLSATQVSIPRLRHRSLGQEPGCSAADDVLVVRFMAPRGLVTVVDCRQPDENQTRLFLNRLLMKTNEELSKASEDCEIRVEGCKLLSSDANFHAERSCTQRVFHYLMPLRWLPDGLEIEQWWLENGLDDHGPHRNRAASRPPSDALRVMKEALRSAESPILEQYTKEESELNSVKVAAGRFGKLGAKKRIPWHNFADPSLRGDASPNNEPVWRVLDRARMIEMVRYVGNDEEERVVAVLEFRGDEFLPQQVRRIVGVALAISHGWLPMDFFHSALDAEVFLETAVAPAGRLYLATSRFHFDELKNGGNSIFMSDKGGVSVNIEPLDNAVHKMQNKLLVNLHSEHTSNLESAWLFDLENNVAPRIRRQLDNVKVPNEMSPIANGLSLPLHALNEYNRTLSLLRVIMNSGQWPETSAARSSVISNIDKTVPRTEHQNGSFTVVNPKFRNGVYKYGIGKNSLPLANSLFPDLADAVFELELALADFEIKKVEGDATLHMRASSSHCAVNCNVQFIPHVDSGRGAGQSLSMIVGLGDYVGGELSVEGNNYDIRYQPVEFDGWRLRHWTLPFAGERFSLVWFSPDVTTGT